MNPISLKKLVFDYLKQQKLALLGFVFVSVLWSIDMSLSPYLLKVIIDGVSNFKGSKAQLISVIITPACLYVGMAFLIALVFRVYDYTALKLYPDMKAYFERKLLSYLLNHSYHFFQNHFTGTLTKKISDLMENLEPLVQIPNEWFYPRLLAAIIAGGTLYYTVHPIFTFILITWALLFVTSSYWLSKYSEKYSHELAQSATRLSGAISDTLANVMSVKLFNNNAFETRHIDTQVDTVVQKDRKLQWYNLWVNFIHGISITLLFAAMFTGLLYGTKHGFVSAGDFAMVLTLSVSFAWSVHAVGQQINRFFKVVGVCNASISFLSLPHEVVDKPNAPNLKIHQGQIELKNILFQYENQPPIFQDFNLNINPGEKVGLVGYSGGGKSTLVKLILRLMDVKEGDIFIDGQNIQDVTQGSLHEQIGVIPQEPELFHRSIMENIRFAKPDASDEAVYDAAKKALCHDFIMSIPNQYQALVGERGVKLSGGQKQRIAIARAFLKNAPILLLDEATSSLDSVTESEIHQALHQVMANKTTLVIAHRLSTLKDMSRILVFDKGRIMQDGSLNTLLNEKTGLFYQLWHMQAQGFIS